MNRNMPITLNCPKCHRQISKTLGEIERISSVICPGCGVNIKLNKDLSGLRRADDSIKKLQNTLRDIGRRR